MSNEYIEIPTFTECVDTRTHRSPNGTEITAYLRREGEFPDGSGKYRLTIIIRFQSGNYYKECDEHGMTLVDAETRMVLYMNGL